MVRISGLNVSEVRMMTKGKAIAVNQNGTCYLTGYFPAPDISMVLTWVVQVTATIFIWWNKFWWNSTMGEKSRWDEGRSRSPEWHWINREMYISPERLHKAQILAGTNVSVQGLNSMFIAKYDTSGNFQWVRTAGGCCDTTRGNAITTDELGNAYVSGYFQDTANFGSTQLISEGSTDVFVVKYDPNGNITLGKTFGWTVKICPMHVPMMQGRICCMTGQIDDHGYFGSIYVGARGNRDVFVAVYDTRKCQLGTTRGGTQRDAGQRSPLIISTTSIQPGFFNDTAYFGADTLRGYSLADFFVSKMSPALASNLPVNASSLQAITANCSDLQLISLQEMVLAE